MLLCYCTSSLVPGSLVAKFVGGGSLGTRLLHIHNAIVVNVKRIIV